jgi:hypothetical protein
LGVFLGATMALGCSVAGVGTSVTPGQDAAMPEGGVTRDLVTDVLPPDSTGPDAARADTAAAEASPDNAPPGLDARADSLTQPPATWVGPPVIVGVGQGGRRILSRDGAKWTGDFQDSKGTADPTKNFAAVAYGNGLVVAVGGGCVGATCTGRLATFNGDKWTDVTLPAGQSWLSGVAYGNGIWVAVGASGPMLTSTDGKRWIQKGTAPGNLRAIAFGSVGGAQMFVAAGEKSLCWRSADGQSWTNMALLFPNDDPPVTIQSLAIGDSVVAAAGDRGRRSRSTNGVDWAPVGLGGNDLPSIVYADRMFFAYALPPPPPQFGVVWISANAAKDWDALTIDGPAQAVAAGVIANSRLFVGATGGTIKTSTDGRGWTTQLFSAVDANAFSAFTFVTF